MKSIVKLAVKLQSEFLLYFSAVTNTMFFCVNFSFSVIQSVRMGEINA